MFAKLTFRLRSLLRRSRHYRVLETVYFIFRALRKRFPRSPDWMLSPEELDLDACSSLTEIARNELFHLREILRERENQIVLRDQIAAQVTELRSLTVSQSQQYLDYHASTQQLHFIQSERIAVLERQISDQDLLIYLLQLDRGNFILDKNLMLTHCAKVSANAANN